jgi:hypothetical protein
VMATMRIGVFQKSMEAHSGERASISTYRAAAMTRTVPV